MVFSSLNFLFLFLPAVLALYFIVPARYRPLRNLILLAFSLLFYAYGEPLGIFIMLVSIVSNYLFARLMALQSTGARRAVLIASVALNLGLLGYYKYAGFLIENINALLGSHLADPNIIMPIGISFFTFQGMSYVFDVYRGTSAPQKNILNVATYIALFPQLVAGPIVRYQTIEQELSCRRETMDKAAGGIRRFIIGLSKKMLIANTMGLIADGYFAADPALLTAGGAWLGAIAFTLQIYFDFSGYSDMAIGLGKLFGFDFLENFNDPYISRSITEFWSRWHMSLSGWFKDYVYIPLGGNRRGRGRQIFNILIVWSLTGLWHGATWNFVAWGMYFALLLIAEKLFLGKWLKKVWRPLSHLYALFFIICGWVIFNGKGAHHILSYFSAMFGLTHPAETSDVVYYLVQYKIEFAAALVLSTPLIKNLCGRMRNRPVWGALGDAGLLVLFLLSLMTIVNSSFNPFIYFRF